VKTETLLSSSSTLVCLPRRAVCDEECTRLKLDSAGRLQLWDLERLDAPVAGVQAHPQAINKVDGCGGQVCSAFAQLLGKPEAPLPVHTSWVL